MASTNNKTPGTSGVPYRDAFMAYDGGFTTMNVMWQTLINSYDSNGDDVSGDTFTAGSISYVGHWNKLQLPNPIKVDKIEIIALQSTAVPANDQRPDQGAFLGSIDGTNWELIYSFSSGTLGWSEAGDASAIRKITTITDITNTNKYNYLVLVVEKIPSTSTAAQLGVAELRYYGHEEGSGSIDTTLKSVYNVPATTGTQLEVYYDGQDYSADTDFDQANEVLDKSGNNLHGSQTGGVGFDPTYKAFIFDGSGDYIRTSTLPPVFENDPNLTQSVWVYFNELSFTRSSGSDFNSVLVINASGQYSIGTINELGVGPDGIVYHSSGARGIKTSNPIVSDNWYHITVTKTPGNTGNETQKIYINGVLVPQVPWNASGTQVIGANPFLTIGGSGQSTPDQQVKGSIANFRLYSKVLNADQVKELYDYQKDYFLGSKSQVTLYKGHLGVGVTEPSGQLELAGDERLQEYPPGPMDDYETLIPGHGVFCVSASSYYTPETLVPWNAFDHVSGTRWAISDTAGYTSGAYTGSDNFTTNGGYVGEWIQIEAPYPIKLSHVMVNKGVSIGRGPAAGYILGSNNGIDWDVITNFTGKTYSDNTFTTIEAPATSAYRYLRMVVTNVTGGTMVDITELRFFGTPGPTTLDKGSLSLTRSLDVPRISRYDVDTETPRYEKLVVDFDTTVNSSPTDISGKGNHGTFYGGAYYSAADKAFVFDGTDDYIETSIDIGSGGNILICFSTWVKYNADGWWFWLGDESTPGGIGVESRSSGTRIRFVVRSGNYVEINSPGYNTWNHYTFIHTGSTTSDGRMDIYMNGVFIEPVDSRFNYATTNITNNNLRIGDRGSSPNIDGQISNFKVYDTVLEPSEVKKLYNLGRTGRSMVISDTAVGIGKVPEAQLDVRGNINSDGIMTNKNYMFFATGPITPMTQPGVEFGNDLVANFSRIEFILGGGFDTSTKTYTIPCSGYWEFSYCLLARNVAAGAHWVMGRWLINGVLYDNRTFVYFKGNTDGAQESDLIGKIIGYYTAGTTISVRITQNTDGTDVYMSSNYSHFFGKMLH